jgi:hypothetical protein
MSCTASSALPFSGEMSFQPMIVEGGGGGHAVAGFFSLELSGGMLCGQFVSAAASFATIESSGRTAAREKASFKPLAVAGHVLCGNMFSGAATCATLQAWAHVLAGEAMSGDATFQAIETVGDMRCPWDAEMLACVGMIQAAGVIDTPCRFDGYVLRFEGGNP